MTESLEATVAQLSRQIGAISDLGERYKAIKNAGAKVDEVLRAHLQEVALGLKAEGKTWPEVGEIMGGVTYQRAHQISKGE